jgi:1,4-alpha-glucan branching enzyme
VPDPQAPETFTRSKLRWPSAGKHAEMLEWYRRLLALRRTLVTPGERTCRAEWKSGSLLVQVPAEEPRILVLATFPGARMGQFTEAGWSELLRSNEDGYGVTACTR